MTKENKMDKAEYLEKYLEISESCGYSISLGRAKLQLAMLNSHPDVVGKTWLRKNVGGCAEICGRGQGDYYDDGSNTDLGKLTKEELDFLGLTKKDIQLLEKIDPYGDYGDDVDEKEADEVLKKYASKGFDESEMFDWSAWVPSLC